MLLGLRSFSQRDVDDDDGTWIISAAFLVCSGAAAVSRGTVTLVGGMAINGERLGGEEETQEMKWHCDCLCLFTTTLS